MLYLIAFTACGDDETKDEVKMIRMFVSELTGEYQPWGASDPVECMLVKEENGSEYFPLSFYGIDGFEYERGFSYELSIEKTTLANPPADAGNIRYKLLEVLVRKSHFHAVESRYAIDADQKDMIEADLHNNLPVPVNGGYIINNSTVSIVDENKTVIKSGNLTTNPPEGEVFPNSYKLITPEKQIITQSGWKFVFEDEIIEYDVFFEEYGVQIVLSARPWLYKDLTEYYKSKYPGSGVRGVLCVQILTYKP